MKNGIILCKTTTWCSRLDIEYLDETSGLKQNQQCIMQNAIGKKLRQFVNYASKEDLGQVYAGGFFHFSVCTNEDGSMIGQKSLSNQERKGRIIQAWAEHLQAHPTKNVVQKRLVFSMSAEFYNQLVDCGINPDQVLVRAVQDSLHALQEKFHKGDSIGYAYGLHHDTGNIHIHVALCPRSRDGAYVGLSKPNVSSKVSGHRDQHGFLVCKFKEINQKWEEALADPEKLWEKLQKHSVNERLLFAPQLTQAKLQEYLNSRNSAATQLVKEYRHIRSVQAKLDQKRAEMAARRNVNTTLRLVRIRPEIDRAQIERDLTEMRALYAELSQLKKRYFFKHRQFHKKFSNLHAKSQNIRVQETGTRHHI